MSAIQQEVCHVWAVSLVSTGQLLYPDYANFMEIVGLEPSPLTPVCCTPSVLL